ncbi:SGNH/GDSL hydrolase family protein [Bosea sp. (in: a-proteobacteria)]|uniref:SGNH/GDSL hydrolase family protein n=1 Tax=Bosea sp. (in: a-proteobacteria) TaxID=1871050 RepID=UPI003B3B5F0A
MPRQQLNYDRVGDDDGRKESLETLLPKLDIMMSELYGPDGLPIANGGVPTIYFRTPANLRRWHAALAKVRAGLGRARVVFIGDSKTVGTGAGTSSGNTWTDGAEPRSKVAHFTRQLTAAGIPTNRNAWFGSSGLASPAAKVAYDARLTIGAGWSGGPQTLGGVSWATNGTTSINFAAAGNTDTLESFFRLRSADGQGSITVDASPTVLTTLNVSPPAEQPGKATATTTLGAHTWNVQRTGGGFLNFVGMIAYDSTAPAVDIINGGAFGTVSGYHASTNSSTIDAATMLSVIQPNLVIIQLGTNNLNVGWDLAVYTADILDIITNAKAAGADVVLEVPTFGQAGGYGTTAQRQELRQALVGLGASQGCMVVDHDARFVSYTFANSLGLHRDTVPHETEPGYADEAQALVNALVF